MGINFKLNEIKMKMNLNLENNSIEYIKYKEYFPNIKINNILEDVFLKKLNIPIEVENELRNIDMKIMSFNDDEIELIRKSEFLFYF